MPVETADFRGPSLSTRSYLLRAKNGPGENGGNSYPLLWFFVDGLGQPQIGSLFSTLYTIHTQENHRCFAHLWKGELSEYQIR